MHGWAHVSHSPTKCCWTRCGWLVRWPPIFFNPNHLIHSCNVQIRFMQTEESVLSRTWKSVGCREALLHACVDVVAWWLDWWFMAAFSLCRCSLDGSKLQTIVSTFKSAHSSCCCCIFTKPELVFDISPKRQSGSSWNLLSMFLSPLCISHSKFVINGCTDFEKNGKWLNISEVDFSENVHRNRLKLLG